MAVLLGLAALWIAVLLPDFVRKQSSRRSGDSITNFSRHLSVLERSNPVTGSGSGRRGLRRASSISGGIRRPGSNVIPFSPRRDVAPAPVAAYGSARTQPAPGPVVDRRRRSPRPPVPARPTTVARTGAPTGAMSGAPRGAMNKADAQRRRQDVIVALGAAALLSFLATLAFGGAVLVVHLAIDVALLGYLAMVLHVTRRAQAASNVAYLARPAAPAIVTAPVQTRSRVAR